MMCIGIVTYRANSKQNRKAVNTRGMLNVKGINIEDDEGGMDLRQSEYSKKPKKGGCCGGK
jgi:hypothetical protein